MQRFLGVDGDDGGDVAGMQRGEGCSGHDDGQIKSAGIISQS